MIEFHFFGMPIKTLGSLGKIRVGWVTGNTHISFFGLMYVCVFIYRNDSLLMIIYKYEKNNWTR